MYVDELLPFTVAREVDVPAGLLYVAEDLPCTCLVEAVLLVPNEFLLVDTTCLVFCGFDVSTLEPLYTSLPWWLPPDG